MLLLGCRLLHYRTSALYNRFDTKGRIGLDINRKIIHNRLIFFISSLNTTTFDILVIRGLFWIGTIYACFYLTNFFTWIIRLTSYFPRTVKSEIQVILCLQPRDKVAQLSPYALSARPNLDSTVSGDVTKRGSPETRSLDYLLPNLWADNKAKENARGLD